MKRLGIVLALGSVVLLSGCVADGYYGRGYDNYYRNGYSSRSNYRDYDYNRDRRGDYRDRYDYDRRY